jgi:hypothetical protein
MDLDCANTARQLALAGTRTINANFILILSNVAQQQLHVVYLDRFLA